MNRLSPYLDRPSVLASLHPQLKLALLVAAFVCAYGMERPTLLLPLVAVEAALFVAAGALENVRRLRVLFVMVPIGTFIVWSLFYGRGEPLFGRHGPSAEALRYASGMALKLELFVGASVLFLSITRVEEFTAALRGLGLPQRVGFTIALAFRLVPLFLSSALAVMAAQRARGLDPTRGSFVERVRRTAPVIVPVFMGALRRADSMAMALEVRGFSSGRERTAYPRPGFAARDAAAGALIAAVTVVYLWLWVAGHAKVAS